MWSPALPAGRSPREVKSPVETSWKADDEGLALRADFLQENHSPATVSVQQDYLSPYFRSPLSAHSNGGNYIIIPLRSPQHGSLENRFLVQANQTAICRSPDIRSFYSVSLKSENSETYRRSPEKRFHSPGPICRICHEDDQDEDLISPCNCCGSLALVHKSCIEKWLSASNTDECEICKLRLPIRRQTRPFWQWFCMTGATHGPQGFYADITCVILLTPLCLISVYLCALGASEYLKHGVWEGTGLGILSFFLLATYLLWFYVTVRYHWKTVQQWRKANETIFLDSKLLQSRSKKILRSAHNCASPLNTVVTNFGNLSPIQHHVQSVNNMGQHTLFVNQNGQSFTGSYLLDESEGNVYNQVLV